MAKKSVDSTVTERANYQIYKYCSNFIKRTQYTRILTNLHTEKSTRKVHAREEIFYLPFYFPSFLRAYVFILKSEKKEL